MALPIAQDDDFAILENHFDSGINALFGNLFDDNGNGADSDADMDDFTITHLNGVAMMPNGLNQIGLDFPLGSDVDVDVDSGVFGFFVGDIYDYLPKGVTKTETFTYTIDDGNMGTSTATVSIQITGIDSDDRFIGTANADLIRAGVGDDFVLSYGGNDSILGMDGSDIVKAGNGNDFIIGGDGIDRLFGENGNDRIFGQNDRDLIYGGNGDDFGRGGNGNDIIRGEAGNDKFFGDHGNDLLLGGSGNDVLNGGTGIDTVRVSGRMDDYTVSKVSKIVWRLTDDNAAHGGNEGSDLLAYVERIQFDDGFMIL